MFNTRPCKLTRLIVQWLETKYPQHFVRVNHTKYFSFDIIWINEHGRILVHLSDISDKRRSDKRRIEVSNNGYTKIMSSRVGAPGNIIMDHCDPDFFSKIVKHLGL